MTLRYPQGCVTVAAFLRPMLPCRIKPLQHGCRISIEVPPADGTQHFRERAITIRWALNRHPRVRFVCFIRRIQPRSMGQQMSPSTTWNVALQGGKIRRGWGPARGRIGRPESKVQKSSPAGSQRIAERPVAGRHSMRKLGVFLAKTGRFWAFFGCKTIAE